MLDVLACSIQKDKVLINVQFIQTGETKVLEVLLMTQPCLMVNPELCFFQDFLI